MFKTNSQKKVSPPFTFIKPFTLVTRDYFKLVCFWRCEFPKCPFTYHSYWEYPFLCGYTLYMGAFSILPLITKIFLIRLIILIIFKQNFTSLFVFVGFFSFLFLLTYIVTFPAFQHHFKRRYGTRAFFLLNFNQPTKILISYVRLCRNTLLSLLFFWFLFVPIADCVNLTYSIYMYSKAKETYQAIIELAPEEVRNSLLPPDPTRIYKAMPDLESFQYLIKIIEEIKKFKK